MVDTNCIDEYCNSKIGCFSLNFDKSPKMLSNYFKRNIGETLGETNTSKNIIVVGYYNDTNNNNYKNIGKMKRQMRLLKKVQSIK